MAIDGKKLVNYLAHGISHTQIAAALNITQARVAQLALEDRVIEAVNARKEQLAEEGVTELTELKGIKTTLVERMSELAAFTDSLSEAVNAYEKLEKITATKMGRDSEEGGVRQIILQAPIFIQNNLPSEVVLDSRRRIASIRGRSMAQMPTSGVMDILKRGQEQEKENGSESGSESENSQAEKSASADLAGLRL